MTKINMNLNNKLPQKVRQYLSETGGTNSMKKSTLSVVDLLRIIQSGVSFNTLFPSDSSGSWLRLGMPWT